MRNKNWFILSRLHRDDVAQKLIDDGMEPTKAQNFANNITNEQMEILATETWDGIMMQEAFWIALDHAMDEVLDIPLPEEVAGTI